MDKSVIRAARDYADEQQADNKTNALRAHARFPGGRIRLRVDHTDMRGNDAPALRKAHPGLHLAADFAGCAGAMK